MQSRSLFLLILFCAVPISGYCFDTEVGQLKLNRLGYAECQLVSNWFEKTPLPPDQWVVPKDTMPLNGWKVLLKDQQVYACPAADPMSESSVKSDDTALHPPFELNIEGIREAKPYKLESARIIIPVEDGWIVAFNAGEFGAGVWWYSANGKERYKVSEDQVRYFYKKGDRIFAIAGIAHLAMLRKGYFVEFKKNKKGDWTSHIVADLEGYAYVTAFSSDDTSLFAATNYVFAGELFFESHSRLIKVSLTGTVETWVADAFWEHIVRKYENSLYSKANSIVQDPNTGDIYLGLPVGVAKVSAISDHRVSWLVPRNQKNLQ